MSLTSTKAALYALFADNTTDRTPVAGLTRAKTVYLGEPRPGDMLGPIAVTVGTGKGTPTTMEFLVRVYGKPDVDALAVQADMDVTIQEVWDLIDADDTFQAPDFEASYIPEIDCLVATFKVTAGRSF